MNRDDVMRTAPVALMALGASLAIAGATVVVTSLRRRREPAVMPAGTREPVVVNSAGSGEVQPAVEVEMPATVPHHFTEELIIPGFTETGADVEEQDAHNGRSPEGV
jgi:hypothetical protein